MKIGLWFISTLGDALYGDNDYDKIITFISDRSKGLVNSIAKVFLPPCMVIVYDIRKQTF